MKNILPLTSDFKIIPENFKNSGKLEIIKITDEYIKAKVLLDKEEELSDYAQGVNVEVFGSNDLGLVYFESKIQKREDDIIYIAMVSDYSIIQRREYSRVILEKGSIVFCDLAENVVDKVVDVSAGGLKIISKQSFELDKNYNIEIRLPNNMNIKCLFQPIRISKLNSGKYSISGKFIDMENIDRVVLVQYAFKTKMEEQNKE